MMDVRSKENRRLQMWPSVFSMQKQETENILSMERGKMRHGQDLTRYRSESYE
jgi:hypothetical protein